MAINAGKFHKNAGTPLFIRSFSCKSILSQSAVVVWRFTGHVYISGLELEGERALKECSGLKFN